MILHTKKNFWGKRPGFDLGDILHIAVNVVFVGVVYALVTYWSLASLAVVLIFLGKWRTLAVQPRFWLPNIKANLVDIIVGISTVALINQSEYVWIGLAWAVFYTIWLLFIKPKNSSVFAGIQALIAQFLGMLALFMIPALLQIPVVMIVLVWLISWSAARHFFSNHEEPKYKTLAMIWGLVISHLAWIMLHWIQYFVVLDTKISVIALVTSVLAASLGVMYQGYKKEILSKSLLIENSIFAGALLAVILATAGWTARL